MKRNRIDRVKLLVIFYLAVIGLTTVSACYFSYQQQKTGLIGEIDTILLRIENEYESITDNFWEAYLPIFEADDGTVVKQYFMSDEMQTPFELMELKAILQRIAKRDNRIRWVAIYSAEREKNYIYYNENDTMREIQKNFEYLEAIERKKEVLEVFETTE